MRLSRPPRTTVCHAAGLLLAVILAAAARAEPARVGALEVDDAWARATAPKSGATSVYFRVRNTGTEPDRLLGAESPVARRSELHTYEHSGGMLRMRLLPDGLPLPPGAELVLHPQAEHVMLIGLRRPLHKGERLPLELTFERAGRLGLEAAVRGRAAE